MSYTKRLAVFASGKGSNARVLLKAFPPDDKSIKVSLLVSNVEGAPVVKDLEQRVSTQVFPNQVFEKEPEALLKTLSRHKIDWIILAGFLRKLHADIIHHYKRRILNIHPSLLPLHGGKGMYGMRVHRAVLNSQDTESGISIHYVNEEYDKGAIVRQVSLRLADLSERTEAALADRIQKLEHQHYPKAIEEEVVKADKGMVTAHDLSTLARASAP